MQMGNGIATSVNVLLQLLADLGLDQTLAKQTAPVNTSKMHSDHSTA